MEQDRQKSVSRPTSPVSKAFKRYENTSTVDLLHSIALDILLINDMLADSVECCALKPNWYL